MQKLLEKIGASYQRVPAVDAQELQEKRFSAIFGRELSKPEIACARSHFRAWQEALEFIKVNRGYAVIGEDDAVLSPTILPFLKELESSPLDFDIVHLEDPKKAPYFLTAKNDFQIVNGVKVARLLSKAVCTAGYVVSEKGLEKLINFSESFDLPIDEWLFNPYSKVWKKLEIYQPDRPLVWQLREFVPLEANKEFDSSIKEKKKNKRTFSFVKHWLKTQNKIKNNFYLWKNFQIEKLKVDRSEKEKLNSSVLKELENLSNGIKAKV